MDGETDGNLHLMVVIGITAYPSVVVFCRDARQAEMLIKQHQSRRAEIENREADFDAIARFGQDLIDRSHFASKEVFVFHCLVFSLLFHPAAWVPVYFFVRISVTNWIVYCRLFSDNFFVLQIAAKLQLLGNERNELWSDWNGREDELRLCMIATHAFHSRVLYQRDTFLNTLAYSIGGVHL